MEQSNGDSSTGYLTKRELFAALAMQGIISKDYSYHHSDAAQLSVQYADALITELKKDKENKT